MYANKLFTDNKLYIYLKNAYIHNFSIYNDKNEFAYIRDAC